MQVVDLKFNGSVSTNYWSAVMDTSAGKYFIYERGAGIRVNYYSTDSEKTGVVSVLDETERQVLAIFWSAAKKLCPRAFRILRA